MFIKRQHLANKDTTIRNGDLEAAIQQLQQLGVLGQGLRGRGRGGEGDREWAGEGGSQPKILESFLIRSRLLIHGTA